MDVIQVELPDPLRAIVEREVAAGRVASPGAFLIEAAQHYAEAIALDDEITAEALAGIADAEAGRFSMIATPEDAAALHARTMARLTTRLAADQTG